MNDLDGTAWIKFTRTWFVCDSPRYHRNKQTELHPARYPEEVVTPFLEFFTSAGGWVLDPFAGSGATLVACQECGRRGVGVELSTRYAEVMRGRVATEQHVLCGDARAVSGAAWWAAERPGLAEAGLPFNDTGLPVFDFSISSPPYGAMLHTSRGGVRSKHRQRAEQGLDVAYSVDDERDLGNIAEYEAFIAALAEVYRGVARLLKPRGYLVIVIQNYRAPGGAVVPLAWDLTRALSSDTLVFQGERIWCQNTKPLGIWGYPTTFVPNYHHHYCLIFRNKPAK